MVRSGNKLKRILSIAPLASAVAWAQGVFAEVPQSVFAPAGPVAQTQLNLLSLTLWIAIGIFVVVGSILLYTVIRFRARPGDPIPKQIQGNTTLEVIWTVIPIIILIVIAVPTVRDAFGLASPPPVDDVLNVRVIGYQWWWAFEYPDLGIVTANELRVPVGKVVNLTLESNDVIHSFWVPRLAGKMDVIPNRVNTMWFVAEEAGIYYGQCAEFCGTSHANMRFRVIAQPENEFHAWVEGRRAVETFSPANDLVARGQAIFESTGTCFACHNVDGTAANGQVGPDLTDFASRTTIAAGLLANTPENLARWLRDPQAVKPGALMPRLPLSDDDIQALTAFLYSLE